MQEIHSGGNPSLAASGIKLYNAGGKPYVRETRDICEDAIDSATLR